MTTTPTDVTGYYKVVYNNEVIREMIPDSNKFHKLFKLAQPTKQFGKEFRVPVQLTNEGGITSNTDDTAFTLNAASSRQAPEATLTSATLVQRSAMSYDAMQKALHALNGKNGKEAFVNLTKDTVEAIVKTATKVAELQYRWGCGTAADDASGAHDNLGEVESSAQVSSGVYDVVLTAKSWCTGIWAGLDGDVFSFDVRNVSDGTQITSTTYPTLTSFTPSTRTIRLTGTQADLANIAAGDHIYFGGPSATHYEKEMVGMYKILNNTGSLFGISASTYYLWGANQFDVGDQPLTMGLALQAAGKAKALGYTGELCLLADPASVNDLIQDESALVDHTAGAKDEYARGARSLKFRSGGVTISIEEDIYMKRGLAFLLPKDKVRRLGANEGTFNMPTGEQRRMFREMENAAGSELRYYWNKGIYSPTPAFCSVLKNIVPQTPIA